MIRKTGGKWDATAWPMYFVAANVETLRIAASCTKNVLVAVNELDAERDMLSVEDFIATGKNVFVDSGVYNLATQHAIRHDLSMDEALSMSPEKVDGFDHLFERYVEIMRRVGGSAWGYIEIDQGGRENKIKTRTKLERLGLRPIPVYHPFNDGWEYFDYLAERYDRICFGNVVMADAVTRKRLIATAWERRRKYSHLWIHALGMSPSETTTAYPINSCDSSTWISAVRWGTHTALITNGSPSKLGVEFLYDQKLDPEHQRGHRKARRMCAYDALIVGRTMRGFAAEQAEELGCDIGLFTK